MSSASWTKNSDSHETNTIASTRPIVRKSSNVDQNHEKSENGTFGVRMEN